MRQLLCACALAMFAASAHGQQPGQASRPAPAIIQIPDSIGGSPAPDCVPRAADTVALAASRPGSADRRSPTDSLCLSRRDAIAQALLYNPQLQVADAQTAQARARRVQGIAVPDPQFSASEDAPGLFGRGGPTAKVVGASITVPFPDKFRLRGKVGTADVRSAESQGVLSRQLIASETSQTYDSLLAALRRRRDLLESKTLAEDFAKKTEARFNAGDTPKLDVIRARLDIAQAENDLIANERDIANARAALNRLLGRPLAAPIGAADSLAVPPPLPDLDRLETVGLATRPELASLRAQQQGAGAAVTLAREYWLPDFFVALNRDYAIEGPALFTTGIALPIPVFFWQHSRGEIAEARYRERELAAGMVDLRAEVGQDIRAAYAAADAALRQALYIRNELLPTAREAYRIASVSYGLGGSSALEVLDSRRSLLDAESQYTDALSAANQARADLQRAVATPLDTLDSGDQHVR
jgi:outer membrane protein, heavy metal efflux system